MLNQTFDQNSLLRLTKRHEIIKFSLGRNLEEYKVSLSEISKEIEDEHYELKSCSSHKITRNNKTTTIYSVTDAADYYALKKITDNIKRLYRVKYSSRHEISEQILRIFEDSSDMMVLRLDIASFFESINIGKVIERIKTDNILSRKSLEIIENTIKNLKISGLPRGLPISSPLSEIFMEEFDESIRSLDGIYYYSRYVDDIIIISTNSDKSIKSIITKKLKDIELEVNEKTEEKEISKSTETVTYLGYQYTLHPISESSKSNKRHVSVKMSKNKINKIKTRIVLSLINYNIKNESYKNKAIDNLHRFFRDRTLRNRIKFLSGNYEVRDNNQNKNNDDDEKTVLKGGLFYNNPLLNNIEQLEELNIFIRNLLFTNKNSLFGKRIRRIPIELRRELASTDFKHGFESRVTHQFFDFQLKEICEIWK